MKKPNPKPSSSGPPPQIVVIMKEDAGPEAARKRVATESSEKAPETDLQRALAAHGAALVPLFGALESGVSAIAERAIARGPATANLSRMSTFYTVEVPPNADPEQLISDLQKLDTVEGAYIKPVSLPPVYYEIDLAPGSQAETGGVPITTDLTGNQTYLNAAPGGIDARYAWTLPGGRGDGVNIIDVEGGWNFSHEDLQANSGGMISGFNNTGNPDWYQHGTAVLGEISGDTNSFGVTGICPNAQIRTVSVFTNNALAYNSANAIRTAADTLSAGDIILIEQHRGGPNYPGGNTQMGFIAIEWWPDDFLAIQYATSKGIIVVEAAGNGSQNLNDAVYNTRPNGFPAWWKNPFTRVAGADCGAIIVGAGCPPPGTNGGNWGPDRSRLGFSNYGSCLDVQGWGSGVTSSGYGDVHGTNAANKNEWYTNGFSGTSSASPIVTGAVGCLQGIQRAARRPVLTPARMRELFRSTGSAQQAGTGGGMPVSQRIGNRPNLQQLVTAVAGAPHWCGVQFTGDIAPGQTKSWFTHSWPDVWQVIWTVVPTAPIQDGNAQIEFKVKVDRQAFGLVKYFIEITNLINQAVMVEARFCVLAS